MSELIDADTLMALLYKTGASSITTSDGYTTIRLDDQNIERLAQLLTQAYGQPPSCRRTAAGGRGDASSKDGVR
jgi:hypothetical protein